MLQPKMMKASGLKRKTRAWNAQFSGRRRRPGATGWSFLYLPPARISQSREATAATPDVLHAQQRSIWSLLMGLFVLSAAASSDDSMCRSSGGSGTQLEADWNGAALTPGSEWHHLVAAIWKLEAAGSV